MNADMGLMSAITIKLALAMDFLFLPTLLLGERTKSSKGYRSARSKVA
jgi:hypothetical protein